MTIPTCQQPSLFNTSSCNSIQQAPAITTYGVLSNHPCPHNKKTLPSQLCPPLKSTSDKQYDVFFSHRGPDTKKTVVTHLYNRLKLEGLTSFLDKDELRVGDYFPFQIENAIKTATVHVVIFSPRYAESKWCLDELVLMLESGAPIIPVFYHVRPNELRREDGKYAEDLRNLENMKTHDPKDRYNSTNIKKWRDALKQVSEISGIDLQETCNGDEGKLVEKVVQCVLEKVKTARVEKSCLVNLDTENDTHMLDRHRDISKAPDISQKEAPDISQKDNDDSLQQSNDHHTAIPKLPNCGQKRKPKCKRYLASKISKSPRRKRVYVSVETKYRHPGKSSSEKTDQTEVLSCCKTEPVIVVVSVEKETVVWVGIMIMILRVVLFLMACKLPHPPRKKLGSLKSFGGKGKTPLEDGGGQAFGEFDGGLSPGGGPSGG